jgi:hypothetical protein
MELNNAMLNTILNIPHFKQRCGRIVYFESTLPWMRKIDDLLVELVYESMGLPADVGGVGLLEEGAHTLQQ